MLSTAIVLFLVAALFGIILLIAVLQDRVVPSTALLLHATFAAVAIILVLFYLFRTGISGLLITGLGLLIIAALIGLTLVHVNCNNKILVKLLAVVHPFIAFAGLILLIINVLP